MAHRLLRNKTRVLSKVKDSIQQYENLLVLDFEATCEKHVKLEPQEIIEFPCIALCTNTWEVKDVFHEYVKPRINPVLTTFCTDLTGIMQEMIDDQQHFPETLVKFQQWLNEGGYSNDANSAFVTCGDWDFRVMLPDQCALDGLSVPNNFKKWINLKKSFSEGTGHYPRSLRDMLHRLGLPLQGRLHSGIEDVSNMVRIIQCLHTQYQTNFKITSKLEQSNSN